MNTNTNQILRLTALWAISEAGIGGLLHAFRLPFTAFIIASLSLLYICLIGRISNGKTILKCLPLVLLFKFLVAPHSPLPAYLAVSFQAFLGFVFFTVFPKDQFSLKYILIGVLGLIESSIQKLITLTIIFGVSFWEAIDQYYNYVSKKLSFLSIQTDTFSWFAIIGFITLYALVGSLAGLYIRKLIQAIISLEKGDLLFDKLDMHQEFDASIAQHKRKSVIKKVLLLGSFVVILLSFLFFQDDEQQGKKIIWFIVRVALVILFWIYVITPLVSRLMNRWYESSDQKIKKQLSEFSAMKPKVEKIVSLSLAQSKHQSLFRRLHMLMLHLMYYFVWEKE